MVAWLIKYVKTFFMNFKFFLQTMRNAYFSCSKQTLYIIRMPISYSRAMACLFSSIIIILFFYGYKGQ